jgi:hypothetical protein
MFYINLGPHEDKNRVRVEIFNEIMIIVMNYHMLTFTDFNLDAMGQYKMGYSFILIILVVITINILVMLDKKYKQYQRSIRLKVTKNFELKDGV